jgi:hypothetical protein
MNHYSGFTNDLSRLHRGSFQVRADDRGNALSQNCFRKVLLSAVDESLSSLGDSSKQAIFYHLETSFNIKRENIPSNLTEFSKALEGIFGPGAPYIEKLIVKRLYEKLDLGIDDSDSLDFPECVNSVKKRITPRGGCLPT